MLNKLSIFLISLLLFASPMAHGKPKKTAAKPISRIEASIVVDGESGKILHSRKAKEEIYPASLTKVMTIYLMFDALKSGKVKLDHEFYISKNATKAEPSKLYLKAGKTISVRDCIYALSIKSANDAAIVAAENLAGSVTRFVRLMNVKARQLGMNNTNFMNPSGWHHPRHKSTLTDLVKLSMAIKRDFPEYYKMFQKTSFAYNGKIIKGHNKIMDNYPGAEGLKTGFHTPAGYNLITTASRNGKNLIAIVTGRNSVAVRDTTMTRLLDQHFGVKKVFAQKNRSRTSPTRKVR